MIQTSTPSRSASVNSTLTVVDETSNSSNNKLDQNVDGSSSTREKRSTTTSSSTGTSSGRSPRFSTPQKSKSMPITPSPRRRPRQVDLTPLVSKETRLSAAMDAAQIGQYTRLQEYVVEAVSQVKDEQDEFFLKAGLHMNTLRSRLFQVIVEAAALGSLKQRHKPVEIVTNVKHANGTDENTDMTSNEATLRRQLGQNATIIQLSSQDDPTELVNTYVKLQRHRKAEQFQDAEEAMEQLEQHSRLKSEWKTLQVELPTSEIPTFRKPIAYMTGGRLKSAIVQAAAEGGNSRQERLVLEGKFKVHQTCHCIYCRRPSPYQTQSYQKLRMRKGWTDDSLEVEDGAMTTPKQLGRKSVSSSTTTSGALSSPSKKHYLKHHVPKKQTLATILQSTSASSNKQALQAHVDPNIPSLFKAVAATSKHHVKSWKSRAIKAKRESYNTTADCGSGDGSGASPKIKLFTSPHSPSARPPPLGAWVSPRGLRKKKKLAGFASPKSPSKSKFPALKGGVWDGVGSPEGTPTTTKWDDTFLSPRSKQKQKLKKLPLGLLDHDLDDMDGEDDAGNPSTSRPSWATTKAQLKRATTKDSKTRLRELEDSRHTPAWSVGAKMLFSPGGSSTQDDFLSPRRQRRPVDAMSMTEHSPFRQLQQQSPVGTTPRSRGYGGSMRRSRSFDGEIDEEELLLQELDGMDLETLSPSHSSRMSSPRRAMTVSSNNDGKSPPLSAATRPPLPPVKAAPFQDDLDDEDSFSSDEDDDDFAY